MSRHRKTQETEPSGPADGLSESDVAAVCARGLGVSRAGARILEDLDFVIPRGSVTGLLGPSGSGKTTLMRALVGLQSFSGELNVLGHSPGDPTLRHLIGYMTQSASVYRDLTVLQNVRYFAALHAKTTAEANDVIALVGLKELSGRTVDRLSGGQQNRVSLACALVSAPQLLVMDEPTVGLDPVLRAELWSRFIDLAADGTTLLVSSHVMEEARHCATLLLLREGQLLAQLSPAGLAARGHHEDLEVAFLNVILEQEGQTAGAGAPPRTDGRFS